MEKTPVSIFAVLTIVIIFVIVTHKNNDSSQAMECENIKPTEVQMNTQSIDGKTDQYASTTKDIMGKSAEGGVQTNYSLQGVDELVTQVFYGESGKSEIRYYLENGKVFYFTKKNYEYELPIYVDPRGQIKSTEFNEFYLANDQSLCFWYSNGEARQNTQAAQDTVKFLVSDLQ